MENSSALNNMKDPLMRNNDGFLCRHRLDIDMTDAIGINRHKYLGSRNGIIRGMTPNCRHMATILIDAKNCHVIHVYIDKMHQKHGRI